MESVDDVDAKDQHGRTALHYAAMMGHEEIVKVLIARGAAINIKNDYGLTPLTEAIDEAYSIEAETNHDRTIKLLVAKGADVTAKGEFGMTTLHWAVNTGQRDLAKQLIAKGVDIDAKDESGRTALYTASWDGNMDLVALLVAKGATVNVQDEDGSTPLHRAASIGNMEIVALLAANGANIEIKGGIFGCMPLHNAARNGHTHIIDFLLTKGTAIHSLDSDGQTALHVAAEYGQNDTVEFLVSNGADVNARNRYGATPLGLAVGGRRRTMELPAAIDADGYCKRGGHFHMENKIDRAIEDYRSAVQLDPKLDFAYVSRGRAWAKKGDVGRAVEDWKEAINLDWRNVVYVYDHQSLLEHCNSELDQLLRETAFSHLGDLERISGYAVGIGGSPGEFYILSLILARPFEEDNFLKMARSDNPVIRAMGLICLARQDISRYEQTIHTYDTDTAEVAYNPAGCGIFKTTLDKLARNIIEDPNVLDYWSPVHTERMTRTHGPYSDKEEWIRQGAEVVKLLLAEGADINVKDQRGDSPLHYAAAHSDTHLMQHRNPRAPHVVRV